jgi:PilZ domain-containing protein
MLTASRRIIDKRGAPRHRVLKQGMLAFDQGGGVDCIVRNLSPNGARIDIVNPVGLPDVFTLVIESDSFSRRCHVAWSSERQIGVVFN